ncbi:hypothetical protein LAD77_01775 [Klebsiella pneumoniae]|nr:hypothetical protein [Klebsiella pneumoniae]
MLGWPPAAVRTVVGITLLDIAKSEANIKGCMIEVMIRHPDMADDDDLRLKSFPT